MSRSVRILIATLALAASLLVATAAAVPPRGTVPPGPRLAIHFLRPYPQLESEILTVGPGGEDARRVVGGSGYLLGTASRSSWSADGSSILFQAATPSGDANFLAAPDGSHPRRVSDVAGIAGPRTFAEETPVFVSDHELVVNVIKIVRGHLERPAARAGEEPAVIATALWAIPTEGGKPRALGPFQRREIVLPSSATPSGRLVAVVLDRQGYRIATLDPRGGPARTVVALGKRPDTASEPMVSPDGTRIAYLDSHFRKVKGRDGDLRLVGTDLMIVPVKGGKPKRILWVRGGARWPAWDPSGSRLSFTTLKAANRDDTNGRPEGGNAVWEVNADGTCATKVFGTNRGIAYGSSWETGEGRDAGPIVC